MDSKMEIFLHNNGYSDVVYIDNRGWCGIDLNCIYTFDLCYGMDEYGLTGRYCFSSRFEAVSALHDWNGVGDPGGNWIVHKGRSGEYANTNRNSFL